MEQARAPQRIFFPGLNILRFYAAIAVVYYHVTQANNFPGLAQFPPLLSFLNILFPNGDYAVTLFFVISGFLITYLLLVEHQKTGTIAVRRFYTRRILRIWPLYYLAVFIAFFVFPFLFGPHGNILFDRHFVFDFSDPGYALKLGFFLLMLPNIPNAINYTTTPATHLWSIGVEEQFYLIWPLIVRRFARKIGWVAYFIIIFKLFIVALVTYVLRLPGDHYDRILIPLSTFLRDWQIESMACGAIAAYNLFLNKQTILHFLYHPVVKYGAALIAIVHLIFLDNDSNLTLPHFLLAVVYTVVILNVVANPKPLFRFENRVTAFLGNLSYGVYIYHLFVMYLILHLFSAIGYTAQDNALVYNLVLYSLVMGLTILVAALSYRFYETPFLRLKERFAIVRSSSTAAPQPDAPTVTDPAT